MVRTKDDWLAAVKMSGNGGCKGGNPNDYSCYNLPIGKKACTMMPNGGGNGACRTGTVKQDGKLVGWCTTADGCA
jgi:hypothetical protein